MNPRMQVPVDRDRPAAPVVELRVHGVGGTTPENMLEDPHPLQVGGDDVAGFYRRAGDDRVEAYSWGGLTSHSGSRSLWLLLLPFALGNVAGWMLPPEEDRAAGLRRWVVRLLALGLTVLYVVWLGGLFLDLLAYQCGGGAACLERNPWLGFLGSPPLAGRPLRRVGVALLIPAALLGALSRLARFSRTRYEESFAELEEVESTARAPGDPAASAGPGDHVFWHGSAFTRGLQGVHIATGLAALAAASSYSARRLRLDAGLEAGPETALMVAGLVVGAAVGALGARGRGLERPWVARLPLGGWALIGGAVLLGMRPGPGDPADPGALPGYGRAGVLTGLVMLALATGLLLVSANHIGRRPLGGTGPFIATALSVLTLGSLLAGSHVWLADALGGRPDIDYSTAYNWFAVGTFLLVAGMAVAALIAWLVVRRRARGDAPAVNREYGDPPIDAERREWLERIGRARVLRRLVGRTDSVLLVVAVLLTGGSFAFFLGRVFAGGSPFSRLPPLPAPLAALLAPATVVTTALPLLGVLVMYRSYRHPGLRRRVGVVWDVITFWPRWFHPLAPPPYSARAVPELSVRVGRHRAEGARVVLSGHSQGSVLAAGLLLRVPAGVREELGLLTHGSPLRRLYARYFPRYFGPERLEAVAARLTGNGPRWENLYRITDPIGGAIFAEDDPAHPLAGIDHGLRDPPDDRRAPGDPLPTVRGHSGYMETAEYAEAIRRLV